MHGYLSVEHDRNRIVGILAIFAYVASVWIHSLAAYVHQAYPDAARFEWLINILSPTILFGIFFLIMDHITWKVLTRFNQADLNYDGVWKGTASFNYDGKKQQSSMTIVVRQTWTKIQIEGTTKSARTLSRLASINRAERELRYEYFSEAADPAANVPSHRGVGYLRLEDNRRLVGGYYTQLGQTQNGQIALVRVPKSKAR